MEINSTTRGRGRAAKSTEKPVTLILDADRADFTDPYRHRAHKERMRDAGAVDLRDNREVIDEGGGYNRIVPIDPTKKV